MPQKFAFIQNVNLNHHSAHSVYCFRVSEAVQALNYQAYLITATPKPSQQVIDYYQPCQSINIIHKHSFLFEKLKDKSLHRYIDSLGSFVFALKSWLFTLHQHIQVIQTSDPEVAFLYSILHRFQPVQLIYDIHVDVPNWIGPYSLKHVSLFLTNCRYFRKQLINKQFSSSHIITLPNGYDPLDYIGKSGLTIRKRFGIGNRRFVIGYVGRFSTLNQEKGISSLIYVASQLQHNLPLTVLAIGGSKSTISKYQSLACKLKLNSPQIVFHPQVSPRQVANHMSAFDLCWLVYPQNQHFMYKMSPMKAIEYAAVNLPIVVSDFPSTRELFTDKEVYFVNPNNQEQIIKTIKHIYSHPQEAKAKANHAHKLVKKYTWVNRAKIIFDHLPHVSN